MAFSLGTPRDSQRCDCTDLAYHRWYSVLTDSGWLQISVRRLGDRQPDNDSTHVPELERKLPMDVCKMGRAISITHELLLRCWTAHFRKTKRTFNFGFQSPAISKEFQHISFCSIVGNAHSGDNEFSLPHRLSQPFCALGWDSVPWLTSCRV